MASAPQDLPLFYKDLVPLNSQEHAGWKSRSTDVAPWFIGQHAVPLTVEEFPAAARYYPIVFSAGDNPVPLALFGLNEGVNVFIDEEGRITENIYVPAYVRRYPFLLARITPNSDQLTLMVDPSSDLVGPSEEGRELFTDGQPSETTQGLLTFCQQFEEGGAKTQAFIEELKKHNLLQEGEVSIQQEGYEQPFIYRGFQMIDQAKLRDLRGDVLRGWNQSGLLPLLFAQILSMDLIREVFGRQVTQGKIPAPNLVPNPALN